MWSTLAAPEVVLNECVWSVFAELIEMPVVEVLVVWLLKNDVPEVSYLIEEDTWPPDGTVWL